MNPVIVRFVLSCAMLSSAGGLGAPASPAAQAVHVATALDHLTVLEFGEPVTMVAAGSAAFQIERHEDKVLIKPLESGASTDLLVWTASRRLIYELDPPGEVNAMNFAVDSRLPADMPAENHPLTDQAIDSIMARAFLAARPIASSGIRERRDTVTVRVEHMLLSKGTVYLHYSIVNLGKRSYRLETPTVVKLLASHPAVSLLSRRLTQLPRSEMGNLGKVRELELSASGVQVSSAEVAPGHSAEGVLAIAQPLEAAALLELTFAPDGTHTVSALVVL